jgi:hypothetical protein
MEPSVVDQHTQDVIAGMTWALSTMGGLIVLLAAWGGRKVLDRLDNIERLLASENNSLREMIHTLDKRLLHVEGRCDLYHARGVPAARTDYDPEPVKWRHPE